MSKNKNIDGCRVRPKGIGWSQGFRGSEGVVIAGGTNDRVLVKWDKAKMKDYVNKQITHFRADLEIIGKDGLDPNFEFWKRRL